MCWRIRFCFGTGFKPVLFTGTKVRKIGLATYVVRIYQYSWKHQTEFIVPCEIGWMWILSEWCWENELYLHQIIMAHSHTCTAVKGFVPDEDFRGRIVVLLQSTYVHCYVKRSTSLLTFEAIAMSLHHITYVRSCKQRKCTEIYVRTIQKWDASVTASLSPDFSTRCTYVQTSVAVHTHTTPHKVMHTRTHPCSQWNTPWTGRCHTVC